MQFFGSGGKGERARQPTNFNLLTGSGLTGYLEGKRANLNETNWKLTFFSKQILFQHLAVLQAPFYLFRGSI